MTWFLAPQASAQLGSLIVTITSPTSGSTVSGTITVNASVTIIGSLTVAGVQFKLDGANLGAEDTTAPYSVPWNTTTASNGSHTLTAVARDLLGVQWTSEPVTVTVFNDTTPPTVSITAPASGSTVSSTITVNASASDNVGVVGVQFRLDGANLGAEDITAPYSLSWNTTTATNGSHTLTAVARDAAGNTATSAAVTVTVFNDTTPPTVTITAPTNGATVSGTITVTAGASDNVGVAGVQFFVDGAPLGAEDTTAPYAVSWNTTTASNGSHTLTARARDAAGNTATSAAVTLTVFNDTSPPTVSITSPTSGATVGGTITVSAGASDNVGVAGVQFLLDGAALGAEDTTAPYAVSWNTTTASNGSHTLTARVRDAAGNTTTSAAVTVTVFNDTTPPTVSMTSPANGATVSGTISVTANASDNVGVAGVQFHLDGVNLGAEDTSAPYAVAWDTTIATNGSHTLTAIARDAAGNTATSAAVTVTVANDTAGTIRIEETTTAVSYFGIWTQNYTGAPGGWSGGSVAFSVAVGARATVSFNGTSVSWISYRAPNVGIANLYLDGTAVATVDGYAPTSTVQAVLYTSPPLVAGSHTLAIEVTRTKNDASSDYLVVVDAFDVTSVPAGPDTTPPTVGITSPGSGATVAGTVAVAASASDNVGVAGVQFFVDGAPLGTEDTAAPYSAPWDTTTVSDGSHTLTAVARDAAGNTATSAPVTVTVSNASPPVTTFTRFENTDRSISYTDGTPAPGQPPTWWHGSRSRGWSEDTSSFNRSAGARATFTFTGTAANWIGFRAFWAGIARVFVDGAFVTEVDLYASDEQPQTVAFSTTGLAPGTHTLTVEATGQKNVLSTDYAVVVDAFDAGPSTPPTTIGTRIEEIAPPVSYTAGWQGNTERPWSGGTAAVSATAGARSTLTFTGTSVSWIGLRGRDTGIARVILDGSFHSEVDTFAPYEIQAVVFTATGLAAASHTLEIEVTGQRNAAATGSRIVVDAFDVRSRFEDPDPAIAYNAGWEQGNTVKAFSGTSANTGAGTAALSRMAGGSAAFSFTGTSVTWIGFRAPYAGIARVFLDGAFQAEVDTYAPAEEVRVPVFTARDLAPGRHTLTIEVTDLRNPSATNNYILVDAFDVTLTSPLPPVTRLQETHPSITYTPGTEWTRGSRFSFDSGEFSMGSAHVDPTTGQAITTAGTKATFSFTGTAVRWIGRRGFATGVAHVSLDGVRVATIDTRALLQEEHQAPIYSVTGLTPGTHILEIEVTGRNNEPPGTQVEHPVWVDAFDVY